MGLFNNKKKKDNNMVDISKVSSKSKASNSSYEESELFGDVGKMEIKKRKTLFDEDKKKPTTSVSNSKKKKDKKQLIKSISVPKTVQASIPYKAVYTNGIIETEDGVFTKTYQLTDANFKNTSDATQDMMFEAYMRLINYFSLDVRPQFIIMNKAIDKEQFKENTLYHDQNDGNDHLRHDLNNVLLSKISEGQSNITQTKYLTVAIKADNIELANITYGRVDSEISSFIKPINDVSTKPMTLQERLETLYNIYNQDTDVPFFKKMNIDGVESRTYDLNWMMQLGLTTKDIVGPTSFEFKPNYFKMGETYGRSMYLRTIPTRLSTNIFTDLADVPCNALISVNFEPMQQDKAVTMVRNQVLNITKNMSDSAMRNAQRGLSEAFVPIDMKQDGQDAETVYQDLTQKDQKAILMTVVVTVFAETMEDLDKYSKMVQNNARKNLCDLSNLTLQQERGLNTCLPLANTKVWANRFMTTESAALFIPFESQELIQPHGLYYGVNDVSRNLIMINRLKGQNSNALILGMPGSGKSMTAKIEMTQAYLSSEKNEIFVIDPQNEYGPLCEQFNGQVIKISPSSQTHLNPFDLDITCEKTDEDPLTVKSDYIASICESAIGRHSELNPVQASIIDRCVRSIYGPYLEHMEKLRNEGSTITCDRSASPTLKDFYNELIKQSEPEAEYLRIALEKYCVGSYNTFAYRTNVDPNNRFIVYDISSIGTGMSEMGMQICLNDIWARTIANKKRGVRTWIYIDELYILTQSVSCSKFLMYMFKQLRKYGGAPTGITQNTEDLNVNREARGILNNCDFVVMLNQSNEDRRILQEIYHISDALLSYITTADSGCGLIHVGKATIPFANIFPNDNELYKIISTNPNDDKNKHTEESEKKK